MKLELRTNEVRLVPENGQDKAYLRDTLGLRESGDIAILEKNETVRPTPIGLKIRKTVYRITKNEEE